MLGYTWVQPLLLPRLRSIDSVCVLLLAMPSEALERVLHVAGILAYSSTLAGSFSRITALPCALSKDWQFSNSTRLGLSLSLFFQLSLIALLEALTCFLRDACPGDERHLPAIWYALKML